MVHPSHCHWGLRGQTRFVQSSSHIRQQDSRLEHFPLLKVVLLMAVMEQWTFLGGVNKKR